MSVVSTMSPQFSITQTHVLVHWSQKDGLGYVGDVARDRADARPKVFDQHGGFGNGVWVRLSTGNEWQRPMDGARLLLPGRSSAVDLRTQMRDTSSVDGGQLDNCIYP